MSLFYTPSVDSTFFRLLYLPPERCYLYHHSRKETKMGVDVSVRKCISGVVVYVMSHINIKFSDNQ